VGGRIIRRSNEETGGYVRRDNSRITLYRETPPTVSSSLPVADVSVERQYDLLIDESHAPVWPVIGDLERSDLNTVARLFGCTPKRTAPHTGDIEHRSGIVVGIGDIDEDVALYAHLTRRHWSMINSARELTHECLPDVIMIVSPRLDATLVHFLESAPIGPSSTGVIWSTSRSGLRRQLLVRSAASALNGPLATRTVTLTTEGEIHREAARKSTSHVPHATQTDIIAAVAEEAGLLIVDAHGTGLYFALSNELTACAMDRPVWDEALDAPECFITGYCSKAELPIAEAIGSSRIIGPEAFSARVVALMSCQAAFIGSPNLDARWSFLPRLLSTPTLGAIIASHEPLMELSSVTAANLHAFIAAGTPVGRALAEFHQTPTIAALGVRLLLFGDPLVCAAPTGSIKLLARDTTQDILRVPVSLHDPGGETTEARIALLRSVACVIGRKTAQRAKVTSHVAMSALQRFEQAQTQHEMSSDILRTLQKAILDHLGAIGVRADRGWLGNARLRRDARYAQCPSCDWPVRPYHATTQFGSSRRLVNCPRCGVAVIDQPVEDNWRIDAKLPRVAIDGQFAYQDWSAAAFIVPEKAWETQTFFWPLPHSNSAERELHLPEDRWPAGPLSVTVAIMQGASLGLAKAVIRAPHI
jgi:hypothetical protein